jgi:CRISPR-associated endonuclease/helicase Cas3
MTKQYYAHSENDNAQKHLLSKHLHRTATLAESFACKEEYKPVFNLTGLLHDLGKYQFKFQDYLENGGRRGSVPHAIWGAGYSRICRAIEISIAIDGHHKGLPDNATWKSDTEPFYRKEIVQFETVVKAFFNDAGIDEKDIGKIDNLTFLEKSHREVFIRYLFSALTDSDWLSTEEHFNKDTYEMRIGAGLQLDKMIGKLDRALSGKNKKGEINQLRNYSLEQALEKADMPCGFYSLALPTGMGKTLTSVSWALNHAKKNGLKRIIIVLPYINIIDQTAQTLKTIFGEDQILEHHSGYNEGELIQNLPEDHFKIQQRKKLACENWDYPIIVTTTVQFFESLFSNKPSQCRKIHNISESVVIFDEVQTLPKEVISPTIRMLQDVQTIMKTSFLFCTATQPAFENRKGFDGINKIFPLVDNPAELFEKTKRVEYYLLNELNPLSYSVLLDSVIQVGDSALVIFNTKKAALEFFSCARSKNVWEAKYHLSTGMCPSHRKDVIKRIRVDLGKKKKILVSSTQLIEAGVDFDFPAVFRAIAPLEAIIQSAGRCNREGKMATNGNVFLFKIQDGGMPDKTYSACAGFTEEMVKADINQLHQHDIFAQYYSKVIDLFVDPDKYGIKKAREEFKFKTVNDSYRIIQSATEGVYIYNFSDENRRFFHSLEQKEFLSRNDYRRMQGFMVQVYQNFIFNNADMCKTTPHGFMVWYGNYDSETGISIAPIEADKLIV